MPSCCVCAMYILRAVWPEWRASISNYSFKLSANCVYTVICWWDDNIIGLRVASAVIWSRMKCLYVSAVARPFWYEQKYCAAQNLIDGINGQLRHALFVVFCDISDIDHDILSFICFHLCLSVHFCSVSPSTTITFRPERVYNNVHGCLLCSSKVPILVIIMVIMRIGPFSMMRINL